LRDFHGNPNRNRDNERLRPAHVRVDQQNEKADRQEEYGISDQIDNCTGPSGLTSKLRQNRFERDIIGMERRESVRRKSLFRECVRGRFRSCATGFRSTHQLRSNTASARSPTFGVAFSSWTRPVRHSHWTLENHHVYQQRAVANQNQSY
jgi:hypothetical protein